MSFMILTFNEIPSLEVHERTSLTGKQKPCPVGLVASHITLNLLHIGTKVPSQVVERQLLV